MNLTRQAVLRKLRPPSLKPVAIIFPYQRENPPNYGYTLAIGVGEPVVAPGDGTVEFAKSASAGWRYKSAASARTAVVRIDHGFDVRTYVHGLNLSVGAGTKVTRGQVLGTSASGEVFMAIEVAKAMINPSSVNEFFAPRDGAIFFEQAGFIRQAPTILRQALALVHDFFFAGLHYLLPADKPGILFNIAFDGDGTKVGRAASGYSEADFWNVYDPIDFFITGYACVYSWTYYSWTYYGSDYTALGKYYNTAVMVRLLDYLGHNSVVFLERVPPLTAAAGSAASWDKMLARWAGGYSGLVPYVNTFNLRGLPPGTYDLYLYADQGTYPNVSYFQVSVDGVTQLGNTNPTGSVSFVQNDNYVKFSLALSSTRSVIALTASGYLSGLQIQRL